MTITELIAAFAVGLAGAGHCLGMCGGITAALGLGGNTSGSITASYHSGRLLSYTALGAAAGYLAAIPDIASWTIALRYCAGLLMVAMGLYIGNWWRGLQWLERGGAYLWRPVQALAKPLLPVRSAAQALGLGLCWGMMPCGLIYSALALAATQQSVAGSAVMMLCFGLGTLPAMVLASVGASRLQGLLRARGLRIALALLLIAGGLWSLYLTAAHSGHLLSPPSAAPTMEHQHH
ncbi:sulfite exporter TauE/SafE family protein [Parahaliea maris]|uniref:Sulfite exporter TauE/SafE family protein n=1 Tax=Parahaliea maris TaxID=2716870 RepID=A0A5C9A3N4_9GAMM|nr:sulfite exporter TauE/SafE family protein [Parahaliea maris]TXS95485.1 sulfite exporter TauE/SafE family protein [Parahaliea maris]